MKSETLIELFELRAENRRKYKAEKRRIKREQNLIETEIKREYKSEREQIKQRVKEEKTRLIKQKDEQLRARGKINPPKRSVLEEIGNSVTHGVGSVFAIVALLLMLPHATATTEIIGVWVYFGGMFAMFTMSCLYHAFPYGSTVKRIFRRFDYSSIYLMIGATFAPMLLGLIGGVYGIVFFAVQWAIIATGISLVGVFGPTRLRFIHMPLYIILGWSALLLIPQLIGTSLPLFLFILAGGIIYSLGIIPFAMKSKGAHFIWHFFVLLGALVQWLGIYLYIFLA